MMVELQRKFRNGERDVRINLMRGMWGRLLRDLLVEEIMVLMEMAMKLIIGCKFKGTVETFK
jgi:hypothetical protein